MTDQSVEYIWCEQICGGRYHHPTDDELHAQTVAALPADPWGDGR